MVTINAAKLSDAAVQAQTTTPPALSTPDTRPRNNAPDFALPENNGAQAAAVGEERKVDLGELTHAVNQIENIAKLANRSVHFRINDTGDDIQVLVINEDTDEVIREIPPDAVVELAERIQGTLGILIDKVV